VNFRMGNDRVYTIRNYPVVSTQLIDIDLSAFSGTLQHKASSGSSRLT